MAPECGCQDEMSESTWPGAWHTGGLLSLLASSLLLSAGVSGGLVALIILIHWDSTASLPSTPHAVGPQTESQAGEVVMFA